jgi:hypothetical protein
VPSISERAEVENIEKVFVLVFFYFLRAKTATNNGVRW